MGDATRSGGLQQVQDRRGATQEVNAAMGGGNMLALVEAGDCCRCGRARWVGRRGKSPEGPEVGVLRSLSSLSQHPPPRTP
jgi:hypothetical protein